jgi:hypothetical protein
MTAASFETAGLKVPEDPVAKLLAKLDYSAD